MWLGHSHRKSHPIHFTHFWLLPLSGDRYYTCPILRAKEKKPFLCHNKWARILWRIQMCLLLDFLILILIHGKCCRSKSLNCKMFGNHFSSNILDIATINRKYFWILSWWCRNWSDFRLRQGHENQKKKKKCEIHSKSKCNTHIHTFFFFLFLGSLSSSNSDFPQNVCTCRGNFQFNYARRELVSFVQCTYMFACRVCVRL